MVREQDDQQRHFERVADDEGSQTALDERGTGPADEADTRPGRSAVTDQPGETGPTGTTGLRDFSTTEDTSPG